MSRGARDRVTWGDDPSQKVVSSSPLVGYWWEIQKVLAIGSRSWYTARECVHLSNLGRQILPRIDDRGLLKICRVVKFPARLTCLCESKLELRAY